MNQALKTRLVGVVVLVALAAILLPLLFDGANQQALLADTRMPPPPQVPDAASLLAEPASRVPEAEGDIAREHVAVEPEAEVIAPVAVAPPPTPASTAAAPVAAPAPVATVAAPAVAPVADARLAALAEAWDVQVAAVAAADGAERLRARLVKAGYKARVHKVGPLFKVLVGPELRRADAEALRGKLATDARAGKPKAVLVRYVP